MKSPGWIRIGGVATVCALVGAGAGIAGSTAATTNSTASKGGRARLAVPATGPGGRHGMGFGRGFGFGHDRAVHDESVVLDKAGKAFITVTSDDGTVKSVAGKAVTISEATMGVAYKDVTVTVADGATIDRNGKTATLADLKAGDHVHVSASSDGTIVFAADSSFAPSGPGGHGFGGPRGPRGPHGAGDQDGPGALPAGASGAAPSAPATP